MQVSSCNGHSEGAGHASARNVCSHQDSPCSVSPSVETLKRSHPLFAVGDRVRSVEGFTGTVRYVGLLVLGASGCHQKGLEQVQGVEKAEEAWIGVQWDDSSQGKHDGCVNGIRYFCCCCNNLQQQLQGSVSCCRSRGSTGASFVKEHKLQKPLTFQEAIMIRYTTELTAEEVASMRVADSKTLREKTVEFRGWQEAQQHFKRVMNLEAITLTDFPIRSAGIEAFILPRLRYLSMGGTLFRDWKELFLTLRCCPNLKSLCLANMRLESFQHLLQQPAAPQAESTAVEGKEGSCCRVAAAVESVFVKSGLSSSSTDSAAAGGRCCSLEVLTLDNTFVSWPDLLCFNYLAPKLQKLFLRTNKLTPASFPLFSPQGPPEGFPSATATEAPQQQQNRHQQQHCSCGSCLHPFTELRALDVSGNKLDFVSLVSAVGRLPSLKTLLAADNELVCVPLPPAVATSHQLEQQQPKGGQQQQQPKGISAICLAAYYEGLTGTSREALNRISEISLEGNSVIDQYGPFRMYGLGFTCYLHTPEGPKQNPKGLK